MSINLMNDATINATLFSTASFDATQTNVANVRLVVGDELAVLPSATHHGKSSSADRDYNGDGRPDRRFSFNTSDLVAGTVAGGQPSLVLQDVVSETKFQARDESAPKFVGGADRIEEMSGDPGVAGAGTTHALAVRLIRSGNASQAKQKYGVAGLRVRWTVDAGGGSFAGQTTIMSTTDADGVARATWRLGAHGGQRVAASVIGPANSPINFIGVVREADGSIRVTPQLQSDRSVTATIGAAGGTITAVAANGTQYSLVIPPNGLVDPEAITVTPTDIPDAPFSGGSAFGVHFAPNGLNFTAPAQLDVTLPTGTEVPSLVGFGFNGSGEGFHLASTTNAGNTYSFTVTHFSGLGGGFPFSSLPAPLQQIPAVVDEATAETALAIIAEIAAVSQRLGIPYDAQTAIAGVLRSWYDVVVKPALLDAREDESKVESAVARYQRWHNYVMRSGNSSGDVQARVDDGRQLMTTAFRNAIGKARDKCIAQEALAEASKGLRLGQQAEVLGLEGMSEALVRADLCVSTAIQQIDRPALQSGRSATLTFKPSMVFKEPAVSPGANEESDERIGGPSASTGWTPAAFSSPMFPAPEVPFYVTARATGTESDAEVTSTTTPGGEFLLTVTPRAGVSEVTVTVRACMRDSSNPRLDDVCLDQVERYSLGSGFAGTWNVYRIVAPTQSADYPSLMWWLVISDDGPSPTTSLSFDAGISGIYRWQVEAIRIEAHPLWPGETVLASSMGPFTSILSNGSVVTNPSNHAGINHWVVRLVRPPIGEPELEIHWACRDGLPPLERGPATCGVGGGVHTLIARRAP